MSEKSVFSKIIDREISAEIIYEDEKIIVIKPLEAVAKIHLLGITKQPFSSLHDLLQHSQDKELLWHLFHTLSQIAEKMGVAESGYKLVTNHGADAGQSVFHLHVHLLGGQDLREH